MYGYLLHHPDPDEIILTLTDHILYIVCEYSLLILHYIKILILVRFMVIEKWFAEDGS